MPDRGKVNRALLEDSIYPHLGSDRSDVLIGPRYGVDFGAIDLDDRVAVVASDPLSLLPGLGLERAGRFALEIVLADVAVSGIAPTHLAISLALPVGMTDDELSSAWRGMADYAAAVDVSIATGHTARYDGIGYPWIGGATAIGIGDRSALLTPDEVQEGDAVVVSTGPAAEVAGLFATLFPEQLELPPETAATARERFGEVDAVRDAATAVAAGGVTAMHDATEGGLLGGLTEMATAANRQFTVDSSTVPIGPGVIETCSAIDVDPWCVSSAGTLVITVTESDAAGVVRALESEGTRSAVVGRVESGEGVVVDGEPRAPPGTDPSWEVFARLSRRSLRVDSTDPTG